MRRNATRMPTMSEVTTRVFWIIFAGSCDLAARQPAHIHCTWRRCSTRLLLARGVDLVSGYATGLRPFLTSLVPQVGREYPAAKHALLSVAARTRSVQLRFCPQQRRAEAINLKATALSHCNTAFRYLTRAGDTQHMPPKAYMVCGALFASTEGWPHRDMLPLTHILNAYRICSKVTIKSSRMMSKMNCCHILSISDDLA